MEQQLSMEHRMTEVEGRSKSNQHRLDDVENRLDNQEKLVTTVSLLVEKEARVEADVKEIKTDVKILTEKPGKRWEDLVGKIVATVAGALIGYAITKIGL